MEKDDEFLDYNIVFNDEIEKDDLVSDEDNLSETEKTKENADNFYANYFNRKPTNVDGVESDRQTTNANTEISGCELDDCNCHGEDSEGLHSHNCHDNCCNEHHHNLEHNCNKGKNSNEQEVDLLNQQLSEEEYLEIRAKNLQTKLSKYKEYEFDDETDFSCELDPSKVCDNCGKCLESYNTDSEGFTQIKIDKIDQSKTSLDSLYKMYGLDDE